MLERYRLVNGIATTPEGDPYVDIAGLRFRGLPVGTKRENTQRIIGDIQCRHLFQRPLVQHAHYDYKEGDVVVEFGAFLGYYSMYVAQQIGTSGKMLAVEMIPEYCDILRANLGPFPQAQAINKAVSDTEGTVEAYKGEHQICSLRADVVEQYTASEPIEVPADTAINILDDCDVDSVDLMVIQINGAELKALATIPFDRVKNFAIYAHYDEGVISHVEAVGEILKQHNFDITVNQGVVYGRSSCN